MEIYFIALMIFGLAILGMAVGLIVSKKCFRRGCEQAKVLMKTGGEETTTCGTCGRKV